VTESFLATLALALVFLLGGRVHVISSRRAALSACAGATIAYVFVQMLPELKEASDVFVAATAHLALPMPELRVHMSALVGFVLFYELENLVAWSRESRRDAAPESLTPAFMLQLGGFALYGCLICYLMVRGLTEKPVPIALYAVAMGLHFLGVDHTLSREHGAVYHRVGRYLLAGAALAGWSLGTLMEISKTLVITGLGFVSGGVIMNSMIMELPSEKDGRFWPFVLGATAYTGLLVLMR